MSNPSLELPMWNIIEEYYVKVLKTFSENYLDEDKRPIVLNGCRSDYFSDLLKKYPAIINLYITAINKGKVNTNTYKQDKLEFSIDVFTAPKKNVNKLNIENQGELAYKTSQLYLNFVRTCLSDLKVVTPEIEGDGDGKKIYFTSNFYFEGIEHLEIDNSNAEIAISAARMKYTVECPFYPSDSQNYTALKEIITQINIG